MISNINFDDCCLTNFRATHCKLKQLAWHSLLSGSVGHTAYRNIAPVEGLLEIRVSGYMSLTYMY